MSLDPVAPQQTSSYGDHPEQIIDFWFPANPSERMVVLLHGGFWRQLHDRGHLSGLAARIAAGGATVALVEYRRVGGDGGYPETFDDVAAGIDAVQAMAPQVVLAGHSAGGHLALWAAARHRLADDRWRLAAAPAIAAVVAIAPVSDLAQARSLRLDDGAVTDFLGATDRPGTDPARLTPFDVPIAVIHGRGDQRVPFEMSERFVAAAGDQARLLALDGVGHFEPIDPATPAGDVTVQTVLEQFCDPNSVIQFRDQGAQS